tara:strand:+ start:111 stop:647 length:537 start_codon:yes stop_codon:yes gene_type:complete
MKIEVIDNFLNSYYADTYEKFFGVDAGSFPWFYQDNLNGVSYIGNYYFNHTLIDASKPSRFADEYFFVFAPLLSKLNLTTKNNTQYNLQRLWRLKMNLYPRTNRRVHHQSHIDYYHSEGLTTCLYYVNDNNGFTIFDRKRKIKSKKNRAILFDGSNKHHSTTPTDCNYRVSINIDYTP